MVRVNRQAADRLEDGHVWVYSGEIVDRGAAEAGDVVAVTGPGGRRLGTAHYSASSQIALRLLSRRTVPIDRGFWRARLETAIEYRKRVVTGSDACRLVHAEGDRLPGLVVDRYGPYLAIQTLSQGMERAKADILDCLQELLAPAGIVERNDAPRRKQEKLPLQSGVVSGEAPPAVRYQMNGLRFEADLLHGQKTGAFLDQRENYLAAARWAHGRALDCFTCSGGFALHMARSCESVEGVDSSEPALEAARRNAAANAIANVNFRQASVFELVSGYAITGRRFSTIVLDPPAFAKSQQMVAKALEAYRQINYRALQLLEPGGVLVTCSCSQHVSEAHLLGAIHSAAAEARKTLRLLERRAQSADHPILLSVPETFYLKCLILEALGD
ncbi:MAG: class I SAM-dependent rRNA methyltransferase [Bryobacteraceae bacterium]|nr:class I SAM-dependent rRNA methyltransferase [Bryobacteraceae bacterium]